MCTHCGLLGYKVFPQMKKCFILDGSICLLPMLSFMQKSYHFSRYLKNKTRDNFEQMYSASSGMFDCTKKELGGIVSRFSENM